MAFSADWQSTNAARLFPIADSASGIDNSGKFLPENVIIDAKLRYTGTFNEIIYISRLILGDYLSLVLSVDGEEVASVSAFRNTLEAGKPVKVTTLSRDCTGWIVFGDAIVDHELNLAFNSANQSGFSDFSAYAQAGSTFKRRFGLYGRRLDGLAPSYIIPGSDMRITTQDLHLGGKLVKAVVFELATVTDSTNPVGTDRTAADILIDYAGECGKRPESRSCSDPQPIEKINGVSADCCGRLFIEVRGCGDIYPLDDQCGIAIVCPFTAEQACPAPKNVPDEQGKLPSEHEDDCENNETNNPVDSTQQTTAPPHWWQIVS